MLPRYVRYTGRTCEAWHTETIANTLIKILCAADIILLIVPLWLNLVPENVQANGRTIPILENTEGPYLVEIRSSHPFPNIGNLHFNIVLWTLEEKVPVNDASVTVKAVRSQDKSSLQGAINTYNPPGNPISYEFNIELLQEGNWILIVDILEKERLTSFEFPLKVRAVDDTLIPMLLFFAFIVMIGIVTWRLRIYSQKHPSKQIR